MTDQTAPVPTAPPDPSLLLGEGQPLDIEATRVKLHDLRLRVDGGLEVSPEELLAALKLLHGDLRARSSGMAPTKTKKAVAAAFSVGKIDLKALMQKRIDKANG